MNMEKANMDIRQYMADHGVTQRDIAAEVGVSQTRIFKQLSKELSPKEKDQYLNLIDAIVADRGIEPDENPNEEVVEDTTCTTKFQIGDRVIIPAKAETIGIVTDIWASMAQNRTMYEVAYESNGTKGLYAEEQLELAPIPTDYTFETKIDGNVAVVAMIAKQGEKTWCYARGHAHILHDGEVGMAQAVSFAARRMFESLDSKQENKIYCKGGI
jgi:DNA-binding XRE family transcriptional regulator